MSCLAFFHLFPRDTSSHGVGGDGWSARSILPSSLHTCTFIFLHPSTRCALNPMESYSLPIQRAKSNGMRFFQKTTEGGGIPSRACPPWWACPPWRVARHSFTQNALCEGPARRG